MTASIIDGTKIAEGIKTQIKSALGKLSKIPVLAAVQIGDNSASCVYIRNQKSSCEEFGITYNLIQLDEKISENELITEIEKLGKDNKITGIILQMPLPQHINSRRVQMSIPPQKDVEGITPYNLGKLLYADMQPTVAPCTALSVIECIKATGVKIKGKEVVIVGHSEIVGKPIMLMLLSSLMESATPTLCHIATENLAVHTKMAEILIVAAGKPGLIRGSMIKDGAIVIDVGINIVPVNDMTSSQKMKTVGDVVFDEAINIASYITPVPGGVGAITTVMLIRNLVNLAL